MSDQLWLFPQSKPLAERLGREFFSKAPRCPGVYIMTDRNGRVLYVGQSQNLRQRLNSYKNIRPDREPRRLVRLALQAEMITWEECPSPEAARLRENELLRLHRPKFNKVNTRPEAYGYIGLHVTGGTLELWLTQQIAAGEELFGAFKGLRVTAYASLLRLLLRVGFPAGEFPFRVSSAKPPRRFQVQLNGTGAAVPEGWWGESVRGYLDGRSDALIQALRQQLSASPGTGFWQSLQDSDLEVVQQFYDRGSRRNRELKERHGIAARLLAPAELDDLLVLGRKERAQVRSCS